VGRKQGVTEEELRAIHEFESSAAFSDLEKLVLRLAVAMTETRPNVTQPLFDELRAHLSDPQLVELTSSIAWENYRSRFNRMFDVESEGYSRGKFCPFPHIKP
jgi:alkylhydroperoxidase family enzyme